MRWARVPRVCLTSGPRCRTELERQDSSHFLEMSVYFTGAAALDTADVHVDVEGALDLGIRIKNAHFGRPPWDNIFDGVAQSHPGAKVVGSGQE
jgi:hypothetical protein